MSRLKQLGKDSVIYGIGGILAKSVALITLPIYTRIFSPADYGTIEMLTVLSSFLGAILVMGMDSAQSMYFFKHKDEGKEAQTRLVSAILQWRLLWGGAIVLIATLLSPLLNAAFFNGQLGPEYFLIAFVSTLFFQVMSQSAEVMRLLYRPWSYIAVTLGNSLLAAALVLLFVLLFDQGILGFFLGAGAASTLMAVVGWYRARDYLSFNALHLDWWPQLLRFGAPLVPAGLAIYFMSTADRWFVQYYHGPEALGLFAVGAKFSLLMALAVDVFRKAWWPIAMDAMHSDDGPETFRLIAQLYSGIGAVGIVLLTLISPWLVQWLAGHEFNNAWPIVGILGWQALLYGFFLIVSAGIWKEEKTYLNLYLMGGAAVAAILLNWLFVPAWGIIGAAFSTVVAYVLWFFSTIYISENLWRVGFSVSTFIFQITTSIAFVFMFIYVYEGKLDLIVAFGAILLISIYVWMTIPSKYMAKNKT